MQKTGWIIGALMAAASLGAVLARPTAKVSGVQQAISLESTVPREFGDWRELREGYVEVVNPQTQALLDKLYSEIVSRVYVSSEGYRVMLSLAYGSDQRGSLQAHKPEVCYPAQGFIVQRNEAGRVATPFGEIPVRRLIATMGARREPITYWFTVGDRAVQGTMEKRLVELMFSLTGRVPDGMLFRVSSIDADPARAYQQQEQFIHQLLNAASPAGRRRLSGLGQP